MVNEKEFIKQLANELKAYMRKKGYNITSFLGEYNKAYNKTGTIQNFSNRLNNGSLKYYEVVQIATLLGYKIKWEDWNKKTYNQKGLKNILIICYNNLGQKLLERSVLDSSLKNYCFFKEVYLC